MSAHGDEATRPAEPQPDAAAERASGVSRLVSGLLGVFGGRAATRTARTALTDLMDTIGHRGLAAAEIAPGLGAAIDQHAAAVRDSLAGDTVPLTASALAGYARGLRESAAGHGWRVPEGPVDWTRADWVCTRLLAVCALHTALA
ncbi:hypothetical protein GCM10010123_14550 [Pilimelia anulata]|uniref:Uncharacterized protein n=1 Tax=Pilimelia anulata TaxID=53371 RepID=A0A8J3B3T6_9ACTN|nr:DUF6401 family natural product biosynthesis protein [Pilimelia anulata]GGJ86041.1 hypothetical protein GCM10010123_14550 [Pilimelia anulata]